MDDINIFDATIATAEKGLNLRSRRHEMIISNVANADTPGYKAFDLMVEDALRQTTDANQGAVKMQRTKPAHMNGHISENHQFRSYIVELSAENNLRGDGNTVDMDREMSNLSANQLLYKATAQIMTKKFEGLRNTIKGAKS